MARDRRARMSCSPNACCARAFPSEPRNIFPSNIQGLPTWYEVRISAAGWLGRRGGVDLMVAMNPQTWDKDVASIEPGGYLLYDFDQADAGFEIPRGRECHSRPAHRNLQPHLYGSPPAAAFQEHPLCRRARVAAGHRAGRRRRRDRRAVQGQGQADCAQRSGVPAGL